MSGVHLDGHEVDVIQLGVGFDLCPLRIERDAMIGLLAGADADVCDAACGSPILFL